MLPAAVKARKRPLERSACAKKKIVRGWLLENDVILCAENVRSGWSGSGTLKGV